MSRVIPKRPAISFPHPALVSGSGTVSSTPDTVPNAFSFVDQTDVAVSSTITSAPITVGGITAATAISVSGGTYDLNGSGSFTASPGTVQNGDTVRVRHTSSGSNSTAVNTVLTIGGISDTFTSTTQVAQTSNYGGKTVNKYVSSTGSNAADGNTEGTAYATVAFALSQISNGQVVGVVDAITENKNYGTLPSGAGGVYRRVVAKIVGQNWTGSGSGSSGTGKYLIFEGFHFMHGATEYDLTSVTFLKFIRCGWQGGVAQAGNTAQHLSGTDQLFESCYWVTAGGRYASICFERTRTLYRWCINRTDTWGSPADDGNPNAPLQFYSSNQVAGIQCVSVDCLPQRSNNEWLGNFSVTTNTGASTGILHQECFGVNGPAGQIGMQAEGSNSLSYQSLNNISVKNGYGFVEHIKPGSSGTVTITGGEYSRNANNGIASFGVASVAATNLNTVGNTGANFNGVTAGAGCTQNALNMNALVTNMVKRGVSETMYLETGWNVQQPGEFMFPLPIEDVARSKYLAFKAARGFTAAASLTAYLKSIT